MPRHKSLEFGEGIHTIKHHLSRVLYGRLGYTEIG